MKELKLNIMLNSGSSLFSLVVCKKTSTAPNKSMDICNAFRNIYLLTCLFFERRKVSRTIIGRQRNT
ncbi:CLUMA_CG004859, isoform A [Clunio marinus]|uniref:CLUMA_CG004859, isoform A n=1 Tax=Clunio marinus TaxID=568069 RepID=A0A1J1HXC3_9DIPT|nr:CLUMA_CG004859, isoform A [Clunio marinus]